jgi:hypothetical protein
VIKGLPAEDGFDFDAWEGVLESPGGGLGLGLIYVAAPIAGDNGPGDGIGSQDGLLGHVVDVFAGGGEGAIEETYDLSVGDRFPVHNGIAMGGGDFHGVNVMDGVFHRFQNLILREFRYIREKGGDALGLAASGYDVDGPNGDGGGLTGGENDVGVVGQDDDVLRTGCSSGFQEFLGAGVHGSLAWNDGMGTKIVEEADEAFTPGHGYDGEVGGILVLSMEGEESLMLLADIVHLDTDSLA